VEIKSGTTTAKGSATDALLWLKRGLWMMAKFMRSMINGTPLWSIFVKKKITKVMAKNIKIQKS